MPVVEIEPHVRGVIARLAGIDEGFSAQADVFRELGLQSAAALDFLLQLEEDFGITISDDAFARARSLAQISALIARLRGPRR